jgi:hypothetical protein
VDFSANATFISVPIAGPVWECLTEKDFGWDKPISGSAMNF